MTLQASGAISLSQIQTEFTGSNPISLSEYYKSGAYVGNFSANANIPTSGQISASQFYSTARIYTINATLATNYDQLNLWDWIVATYGTYSVPYAVTFNNNARIYSTNASASAFTTGTGWPSGSTITIVNNSEIIGRGGNGGAGGTNASPTGGNGGAGGTAISLSYPVTIYNNSVIYAGGGGAGGGGLSRSTATYTGANLIYSGGGGGAAQGNGTNGVGGASNIPNYLGIFERNGADGSSVTTGVGGIGGKVYFTNPGNKNYAGDPDSEWLGGNGGNSAGYGQAGNSGNAGTVSSYMPWSYQNYSGGSGGAAGYAVQTNGNSLTWATYGTVTGTVA
jgi:hypothetical protein